MRRILVFLALGLAILPPNRSTAADRPNILWISCEDISSHLGCYGDPRATTPHLDQLATEGVRYTHAFTCHGVCAPSRTGIITGMSPISLGANHMRSKALLPDRIRCFPESLREAGYYCTNNSKTDYNFVWNQNDVWDESSGQAHWKNRPSAATPFFAVFNLTMTHESKIWPEGWEQVVRKLPAEQRHHADDIQVPPLYPDTPAVRAAHARLLDIITVMDQRVGELLQELESAGLAENTIVLFWSDHGDGFPRAKRWIYDSGTRVPMIARIPERFRTAGQGVPGSTDDRLINLIDLGPTMLHLAGLEVSPDVEGQPFLGPRLPPARQYIYGARDRVDERFDLVRAVRDRRFRYVRNLMPWRPALQEIAYSERSVVRQEMRRLLAAGTLAPESAQWFHAPRAPEELYDLDNDPWELHNLALDPRFHQELLRLSEECDRWQLTVGDAHLLPEAILAEEEHAVGSRYGILRQPGGRDRTGQLLSIAMEAALLDLADSQILSQAALHEDPAVRWWALMGLANRSDSAEYAALFERALRDSSASVRIAAASALLKPEPTAAAVRTLRDALGHSSEFVRHAAILTIDEAGPAAVAATADAIEQAEKNEYISRLAEHALHQ